MRDGVRGHACYAMAASRVRLTKRHEPLAGSLIQNVRSFRIAGATSIRGYRIINYRNLEPGVSLHVY